MPKYVFFNLEIHNSNLVYTGLNVEQSNCTDGDIRVVDGVSENEGRIEVCYNHVWGTVCNNSWSSVDASVFCGQLGYQPFGMLHSIASLHA